MTITVYSNKPKRTRKRLLKVYGMKNNHERDIFFPGKDDFIRIAFNREIISREKIC